jgi:hypothetical protein
VILSTDAAGPGWGGKLTLISAPLLIQRLVPNSIHPLAQQYNQKSNLLSVNYLLMAYGRWKENMSHQSSNRRELVAIHQALKTFAPIIQENKIKSFQLFSDNATAVYNLNRKAAVITLHKSLLRLLSLTTTMGVNIVAPICWTS